MSKQNADTNTEGLLNRLKVGDPDAFKTLYTNYFKLLVVSAYYFLKDEAEAYDVTQSLFIDIWERKLYLNFHEDIKGYLYLAIRNRCFNNLKSKERLTEQRLAYQLFNKNMEPCESENGESTYSMRLPGLLDKLKGQRKTAVHLVYFEKKKYSEAASEMGIGINSLKTHLKSALKVLRNGTMDEK